MANAGGVELCIAAMQGGALGSLPCGMLVPDQVREQVAAVRARASGPINLNFLCHRMPPAADDSAWRARLRPFYEEFGVRAAPDPPLRLPFDDEACAVVEQLRPEVISFHFGLPDQPLLDRVKSTSAVVLATATNVAEARHLEQRSVDAIIAQGFEAGGHSGRFLDGGPAEALGLFALLPQLVAAVRVPVIAAAGIADGRGIAAALTLGAAAVQVGTAFLHCPESLLTDRQRALLRELPTIVTTIYSGRPARALRGRLVDALGPMPVEAPPYPLAGRATMPLFQAALQQGDAELLPPLAGQGAALGRPLPAAQLTEQMARQALDLLGGSEG